MFDDWEMPRGLFTCGMFSPFWWAGDDQPYPGMEGAITSNTYSLSAREVVSRGITFENSMTDPAER